MLYESNKVTRFHFISQLVNCPTLPLKILHIVLKVLNPLPVLDLNGTKNNETSDIVLNKITKSHKFNYKKLKILEAGKD